MEKLYLERIREANKAIEMIQSSRIPLSKKRREGVLHEEDRMELDKMDAQLSEWKAERSRQFESLAVAETHAADLVDIQPKNSEDKSAFENSSFRGITHFPKLWTLEPTDADLAPCREWMRPAWHCFSNQNEAGAWSILSLVLLDVVVASGFALRIYPKPLLEGRPGFTIGPRTPELPPIQYHIVAIQARARGSGDERFWHCVAQVYSLYKARAEVELDASSWGIVSDGTEWKFIHMDNAGGLWASETYMHHDTRVNLFLHHIMECCYRVGEKMPPLPGLPELR
jgi:hypothetical protein